MSIYTIFEKFPLPIKKLIRSHFLISKAITDTKWAWYFRLLLENWNVPDKYQYLFCPQNDWEVFIDCWANIWLIIDIARFMDMEVYAFEPNPQAIRILNKKYLDDNNVHIYQKAVSNKNWKMDFYLNEMELFDQWATTSKEMAMAEWCNNNKITVDVVRLVEFIKNDILPKHKKVHLLKIDIEWAEFDVIDDIIEEWLHNHIKYIVVETHERFFKDWKTMLKNLSQKIKEKWIKNIFLDRI